MFLKEFLRFSRKRECYTFNICFKTHLLVCYVFAHQNVLRLWRITKAQIEIKSVGTRYRPESDVRIDRFNEVWRNFSVIARQRLCKTNNSLLIISTYNMLFIIT